MRNASFTHLFAEEMPSFLKIVEHHVMPLVRHIDQMREQNDGESCREPELSDTLQDWSISPALPRFLTESMREKIVSALRLYGQYDQDFEMQPHHIERLLYGDEERQRQQKEEMEQQEKQRQQQQQQQQQQQRQALASLASAIEEINRRLAKRKEEAKDGEESSGQDSSSADDMDVETSDEKVEFLSSRNSVAAAAPLSFLRKNNNTCLDEEEVLVIDLSRHLRREEASASVASELDPLQTNQRPNMVENKVLDAINRLERKQQRRPLQADIELHRQQREERRKREAEERARNAPLKRYLCRKCKTRNTTFYTAQQRQGPPKTVMECPQCRYRCFVSSSGWDVTEKQEQTKNEEEKKEKGEITNKEEEEESSSESSSSSESTSTSSSSSNSESSGNSSSSSGKGKDSSKAATGTNGSAAAVETPTEKADEDSMAE